MHRLSVELCRCSEVPVMVDGKAHCQMELKDGECGPMMVTRNGVECKATLIIRVSLWVGQHGR